MKMLRTSLCGILCAAMFTGLSAVPVTAEKDIKVSLDGRILSFDVLPQIINDRTMVPLRAIFEALGANVEWNEETRTVISEKCDIKVRLTIDSDIMYVNNVAVTLDTPACIVNDRTLVPVRAVSEAYKANVDWKEDTKTVVILSVEAIDYANYLSAYANLKNTIINKGKYQNELELYRIFMSTGTEDIYFDYYVPTDNIEICVADEKKQERIMVVFTEHEDQMVEFMRNEEILLAGGYIDSGFARLHSVDPESDDELLLLINRYLNIAQAGLDFLDTGVAFENLGVPVKPVEQ